MVKVYKVKCLKGAGLTIWPFIFVNPNKTSNLDATINHEKIHIEQQKEMLIIFFYIWYFIEWPIRIIKHGKKAQKNISLEREGYKNRLNLLYLSKRKRYAWIKYL